jgi:hypothetical protein
MCGRLASSADERLRKDPIGREPMHHPWYQVLILITSASPQDLHRPGGLDKAGNSTEVPSGSTRKSGEDPDDGAGGPSRTKHTICGSRGKSVGRPDETKVTPTPFRVILTVRLSARSTVFRLDASRPTFSRYHRIDRLRSDTNMTTSGVVGAAVVHGASSAIARLVAHSIQAHVIKTKADLDRALDLSYRAVMVHEPSHRREAI